MKREIKMVIQVVVFWIILAAVFWVTGCTEKYPAPKDINFVDSTSVDKMIAHQVDNKYYNQTDYSMHFINLKQSEKIRSFITSMDYEEVDKVVEYCIKNHGYVSDKLVYKTYLTNYNTFNKDSPEESEYARRYKENNTDSTISVDISYKSENGIITKPSIKQTK